jgi:GxxExxY protein
MNENEISNVIIQCAIKVHKALGPGLLETIYEGALMHELKKCGLNVLSQVGIPVVYDGENLGYGYRIDLLVEHKVIIEVKSVESFHDIHFAQTLTYLKLADIKLGLLINFNSTLVSSNVKRVVNKL